jgi:hypothetical protein
MNRGRVGGERRGKETDGCPLIVVWVCKWGQGAGLGIIVGWGWLSLSGVLGQAWWGVHGWWCSLGLHTVTVPHSMYRPVVQLLYPCC